MFGQFITFHEMDDALDINFVKELAQYRSRTGPLWNSVADSGDSIAQIIEKRTVVKPLDWWGLLFQGHPLFLPARRALSMVPTSAAVERANSAQGAMHFKSRNRLAQSRVNALMKISFNRRMEATANAKAEERSSLARTFAITTDVTVQEGSEEEAKGGEEEDKSGEEEEEGEKTATRHNTRGK